MTIHLTPELEALVREKAIQSGLETDAYLERLLRQALLGNPPRKTRKPISDRFEEIRRNAPAEVREALNELPADFAVQHDHYLYGAPKKLA